MTTVPQRCLKLRPWPLQIGADNFIAVLEKVGGPNAISEWRELQRVMKPLANATAMLPATAFRFDPGVLITALFRYLPQIIKNGPPPLTLQGPFSKVAIWICFLVRV